MSRTVQPDFCPECGIGLNAPEKNMGFCKNCKANWNPDDFNDDYDSQYYDED